MGKRRFGDGAYDTPIRWLKAKYYFYCKECGEEIRVGDLIAYNVDTGTVTCESCGRATEHIYLRGV
jgi:transcription elongation factor Elf1